MHGLGDLTVTNKTKQNKTKQNKTKQNACLNGRILPKPLKNLHLPPPPGLSGVKVETSVQYHLRDTVNSFQKRVNPRTVTQSAGTEITNGELVTPVEAA